MLGMISLFSSLFHHLPFDISLHIISSSSCRLSMTDRYSENERKRPSEKIFSESNRNFGESFSGWSSKEHSAAEKRTVGIDVHQLKMDTLRQRYHGGRFSRLVSIVLISRLQDIVDEKLDTRLFPSLGGQRSTGASYAPQRYFSPSHLLSSSFSLL